MSKSMNRKNTFVPPTFTQTRTQQLLGELEGHGTIMWQPRTHWLKTTDSETSPLMQKCSLHRGFTGEQLSSTSCIQHPHWLAGARWYVEPESLSSPSAPGSVGGSIISHTKRLHDGANITYSAVLLVTQGWRGSKKLSVFHGFFSTSCHEWHHFQVTWANWNVSQVTDCCCSSTFILWLCSAVKLTC